MFYKEKEHNQKIPIKHGNRFRTSLWATNLFLVHGMQNIILCGQPQDSFLEEVQFGFDFKR